MFLLRRPSPELVDRVLEGEKDKAFSYLEVGMTRVSKSPGYPRNHYRFQLGKGAETFTSAIAALRQWAMYDLSWIQLFPTLPSIEAGCIFVSVVQHLGFWSINPCRVVYVEEHEDEHIRSWAFAIGTLPAHSEKGEERFRIEWNAEDDFVYFEIMAYASPQHWFAWLGYPYVRHLQHRFGREALSAVADRIANTVK